MAQNAVPKMQISQDYDQNQPRDHQITTGLAMIRYGTMYTYRFVKDLGAE